MKEVNEKKAFKGNKYGDKNTMVSTLVGKDRG